MKSKCMTLVLCAGLLAACQDQPTMMEPPVKTEEQKVVPVLPVAQAALLAIPLEDALERLIPAADEATRRAIGEVRDRLFDADTAGLQDALAAGYDSLAALSIPDAELYAVIIALDGVGRALALTR